MTEFIFYKWIYSSVLFLSLSAAARHGGADLHCGFYNVISLSLSILTDDQRGMYRGEGGKTGGK